jgi:hypothetical protein
MIPFAFGEKLMTRLNLDLTTKQINLLFKALYTLDDTDTRTPNLHGEIMDLMRYLDSKVFVENK